MILRAMIVDDDGQRAERIASLVRDAADPHAVELSVVRSAAAAAQELAARAFDVMILDVNLPLRDGEPPRRDGGLKVLRAMHRRPSYRVPNHIVGITAFEDIARASASEFDAEMWALLIAHDGSDAWLSQLERRVEHVVRVKRADDEAGYRCDLGIVTALHEVELESVLRLNAGWQPRRMDDDATVYHEGRFEFGGSELRVIAAGATEMGMVSAAMLSTNLIGQFRPKYLAMAGIAAGVGGAVGDVLVADQVWDYGSGKLAADGRGRRRFLQAPLPILLDPELKQQFLWFGSPAAVLSGIRSEWKGPAPAESPRVRVGPMASGAAVIADERIVEEIRAQHRKIIGVEMEAYGVFQAARLCRAPRPRAFSIKCVCDFGDGAKSDEYQQYAAYVSARVLFEFAVRCLR